ncbi:MAG: hypothetical protein DBX55_10025 [Verrucomicrobia bacterium]|nr:MAG: hypothetical protein DBX55_10025 [Verrucomicrobiota bacterium]
MRKSRAEYSHTEYIRTKYPRAEYSRAQQAGATRARDMRARHADIKRSARRGIGPQRTFAPIVRPAAGRIAKKLKPRRFGRRPKEILKDCLRAE